MTAKKKPEDLLPVGRPTSYKPEYCEQIIECMSEGHSVAAFAGRVKVARNTVYEWAKQYPEFYDALKVGQARATDFWEKLLVTIARDGGGNATAAIFALKNRAHADWADRIQTELTGKDGGPLQVEQATIDATTIDPTQRDTLRDILLAARQTNDSVH